MSDLIHWVELAVSGGIVVALFKLAALVGSMQQEQKNHAKALDKHDERIERLEGVYIKGAR